MEIPELDNKTPTPEQPLKETVPTPAEPEPETAPASKVKLNVDDGNLFDFSTKAKKDKKSKKKKKKRSKKEKDGEGKKSKKSKKGKKSKETDVWQFKYSYEQMLGRITNILVKNNPYSQSSKKFQMKPIHFERVTKKKYKWTNFREFVIYLKRQPEHLAKFVGVSLGINYVLQQEALLLEGKRLEKESLQQITRRYVLEYIKCPFCSSTSTQFYKDSTIREYILKCDACMSSKTMQDIKSAGGSGRR